MAKLSLEQEGYAVTAFMNAEFALKRLLAEKFDVLITDSKMEGIDGIELLSTVKNIYPATKVIMISSYANLDTAINAARLDIHDVFKMPVRLMDLKASIKRALQIPSNGDEQRLPAELEVAAFSGM